MVSGVGTAGLCHMLCCVFDSFLASQLFTLWLVKVILVFAEIHTQGKHLGLFQVTKTLLPEFGALAWTTSRLWINV